MTAVAPATAHSIFFTVGIVRPSRIRPQPGFFDGTTCDDVRVLKTADDLATTDDPAWPKIQQAIDVSPHPVSVLPMDHADGLAALYRLQVTARSGIGALALNCGGLIVDHGWLRILGGGSGDLPGLASANGLNDPRQRIEPPPTMTVAYDVLGGRFAIDGGGLGLAPGEVCYFGPDTLGWESLGIGHFDFVLACLSGWLPEAFASLRWSGWQQEVEHLPHNAGLSLYPPPWSVEGKDIGQVNRRPVPLAELHTFYEDTARQLGGS